MNHLTAGTYSFARFLQDVHVHDQLADLALEALDLLVFEGVIVQRPAAEGVLRAAEEAFFALLDLGDGQRVGARGFRRGRVAPQDLEDQRDPALGGPALEGLLRG
jgi:hypothetical protein